MALPPDQFFDHTSDNRQLFFFFAALYPLRARIFIRNVSPKSWANVAFLDALLAAGRFVCRETILWSLMVISWSYVAG
jgi:hypothetical protein